VKASIYGGLAAICIATTAQAQLVNLPHYPATCQEAAQWNQYVKIREIAKSGQSKPTRRTISSDPCDTKILNAQDGGISTAIYHENLCTPQNEELLIRYQKKTSENNDIVSVWLDDEVVYAAELPQGKYILGLEIYVHVPGEWETYLQEYCIEKQMHVRLIEPLEEEIKPNYENVIDARGPKQTQQAEKTPPEMIPILPQLQ